MNPRELILQVERSIQFGRMDDWQVVIPVYQTGARSEEHTSELQSH